MTNLQLAAIVLVATAGLAYANARFFRLPTSVGLMAAALVASAVFLVLEQGGVIEMAPRVRAIVAQLDFGNTLLHGLLGLMLFAGALHLDVSELGAEKLAVGVLAIGSTIASTALVAVGVHYLAGLPWIEALLFGALIAPTDPIAVLGMLKVARAPGRLSTLIAGESLFNDGVGVVLFSVVLAGQTATVSDGIVLFLREMIGGGLFGFASGYLVLRLLRTTGDPSTEVLLTLALVVGGYAAAESLGLSAPIAAVVAGLVIGNDGTRAELDAFWKLVDEVLNAVLFLMIGLVLVLVPVSWSVVGASAAAVVIVLAARLCSVGAATFALPSIRRAAPRAVAILTWGGLRGGLSIAMALSLADSPARDQILVMTYAVVAVSILVQGLSFPWLLRRLNL